MKIATYNLWNTAANQPTRLRVACEELSRVGADVVALQEVPTTVDGLNVGQHLGRQCGYPAVVARPYPDEPNECLAFLSKYTLSEVEAGWDTPFDALSNCGLRVSLSVGGASVAITNVHLDWSDIAIREAQIHDITAWIDSRSRSDQYELLCGDFNCSPDSSVYRFLAGQQSLGGHGTTAWHDLPRHFAKRSATSPAPTLDFWSNPRWRSKPTLEIPTRVDWILLRDTFEQRLPYPKLLDAGIFGTTPIAGLVPSDHYGVYANLDFTQEHPEAT